MSTTGIVVSRGAGTGVAVALVLAILLFVAGASLAELDRIRTRSDIAAASAENRTLRARQAALHADALEVSRRLAVIDISALALR